MHQIWLYFVSEKLKAAVISLPSKACSSFWNLTVHNAQKYGTLFKIVRAEKKRNDK